MNRHSPEPLVQLADPSCTAGDYSDAVRSMMVELPDRRRCRDEQIHVISNPERAPRSEALHDLSLTILVKSELSCPFDIGRNILVHLINR